MRGVRVSDPDFFKKIFDPKIGKMGQKLVF